MRKELLEEYINRKDPNQPQIATRCCIRQYPVILLADSESPDQTAHPRSLIRAFAVRLCLGTFPMMPVNYIFTVWMVQYKRRIKRKGHLCMCSVQVQIIPHFCSFTRTFLRSSRMVEWFPTSDHEISGLTAWRRNSAHDYGVSLHNAFHYHPFIVSILLT